MPECASVVLASFLLSKDFLFSVVTFFRAFCVVIRLNNYQFLSTSSLCPFFDIAAGVLRVYPMVSLVAVTDLHIIKGWLSFSKFIRRRESKPHSMHIQW